MSVTSVWWRHTARNWIDAIPLGDGRLGAKVFGGTNAERLALNIETLWSGRPQAHGIADGPATLARMRESLLADRRVDAEEINRAFQGPFNHAYQPLGDLLVEFTDERACTDYRHDLDLTTGVSTCSFMRDGNAVRRRSFVSAAGRAIVVAIDGVEPASLRVRLETQHPLQLRAAEGSMLSIAGFAPATIDREACHSAGRPHPAPAMTYGDDAGVGFAATLSVEGDCETCVEDGALLVSGRSFRLFVTAETTFDDWRSPPSRDIAVALASAKRDAAKVANLGLDELLRLQQRDHGELFGRATLTLGTTSELEALPIDERIARVRSGDSDPGVFATFYAYARYLLISSSRRGNALPANLQGIWNDNRNPPWFCSFTTNINVQMNYWLAEPGGLSECADPYLDYIESLAEAGTVTAREMFGLEGWCANHNADIWRASWPSGEGLLRPTWSFEPTCGLWLAAALAERLAFHPDSETDINRALAIHEGAARFALGLLVRAERGLVVVPSVSPENNYVDHHGDIVDFDLQTTYDLWLVRETLTNYLAIARRCGSESGLDERVRAALAELGQPPIGSDGRLMEWPEEFVEPEPGHRHLSHLYGLYPGHTIDPVETPDYALAARRSLDLRMTHGAPEHGWPHAWMAAMWARLHDAQKAHWVLENFVRTSVDGSSLNYHSFLVYQIDGNLGIGAAISEMIVQSHRGTIRLLPALPAQWSSGSCKGFRARGGISVSLAWADGRGVVELIADGDVTTRLSFPNAPFESVPVELKKNTPWTRAFALTLGTF